MMIFHSYVSHYQGVDKTKDNIPLFMSTIGNAILVGGLEQFIFFQILGMSSSQLTFIFFRRVGIPPTSTGY